MTPTLTTSMENTAAARGVPKRAETQAALTDHIDRFAGLERIQPLPHFIHRDIAEALDMSLPVFLRRAHIQQDSARNRVKFLHAPFLLI